MILLGETMNDLNGEKTNLDKLEEFFSNNYRDPVYEALEKYPEERSLIVDFNDLEEFDADLADYLIERPMEVIKISKRAIKKIDPLMKNADLNVRFENISNQFSLTDISSRMIGKFVKVRGIVDDVDKVSARVDTAKFECRGCMRIHEVEQDLNAPMKEPAICSECGCRSFRWLKDESTFEDVQSAVLKEIILDDSKMSEPIKLLIYYEGDLIRELKKEDIVDLTGTLKTIKDEKTGYFNFYLHVNHIEFIYKWGIS